MNSNDKPDSAENNRFYSRPKDESLQAFKDWIDGMTKALNPDAKDDLTEEEWEAKWREFWSKTKHEEKK